MIKPRRDLTPEELAWATQERLKRPPTAWYCLTAELKISRQRLKTMLPTGTVLPRRRVLTSDELAIARSMAEAGIGKQAIAYHLRCGRKVIDALNLPKRTPNRSASQKRGDPVVNVPIGAVPKGHPLYELDQEMLRARTRRQPFDYGRRQSSLLG